MKITTAPNHTHLRALTNLLFFKGKNPIVINLIKKFRSNGFYHQQ